MIELVLTIIGRDRAGVVASLADVVRFHEGNWKRSELAEIAGTFAGVVVVEVGEEQVDELLTNLLILRDHGLHVTAQQVEEPTDAPDADEVRLRLTGDDRPGIVHELSTAISRAGVSISRLGTVTDLPGPGDARRFEITAQLAVPGEADLDAVLDSIGAVALELGIDLSVEDLTGDEPSATPGSLRAVPENDPLRSDLAATSDVEPARYALSAVVYAERDGEILLLQRAEGSAMAGQWFLPGGFVEPGELPEEGARRELFEEGGVHIDGDLEIIGCYPMYIYGYDMLQISYRGRVAAGDVTISHEHDGARWVTASDMRALLTDDVITDMAGGNDDVARLLAHIRTDLDRYLSRIDSN